MTWSKVFLLSLYSIRQLPLEAFWSSLACDSIMLLFIVIVAQIYSIIIEWQCTMLIFVTILHCVMTFLVSIDRKTVLVEMQNLSVCML